MYSRPAEDGRKLGHLEVELMEFRVPFTALDQRDLVACAVIRQELRQISRVVACCEEDVATSRILGCNFELLCRPLVTTL